MTDHRIDFPIFNDPGNRDVIYFDSAATAQRPQAVLDAVADFYTRTNANPLRGLYDWSAGATESYEAARIKVQRFIKAAHPEEIIFTRNTTESLNLIAYSWALDNVSEGDEIVVSIMEHHSNLLPWQMVAEKTGARLVFLEPDEQGVITEEEIRKRITGRTRLTAICHVSNVYGITNPVRLIADITHEMNPGAVVVVDGAQATPHIPVDVQSLRADFYAFSGHKLMAPMGIGVLYGKKQLLEGMSPFLTGGEMIEYVTRLSATWAELPHKFEAGTVNAAGAVGLGAAIDYIRSIGFEAVEDIEKRLTARLMSGMRDMKHIHILGHEDPARHSGIVTFTMDDVHPHDIASVLNDDHICIRAGHHCAQPLMEYTGAGSTARASMYIYNTEGETDIFLDRLSQIRKVMGLTD